MAFPFGGHPTFDEYIDWAQRQGCTIEAGIDSAESIPLVKITAPNGRWVVEAGMKRFDRLSPATVGRLDRRLGLSSPWVGGPPIG
jgi:hypothetical protein